MGESEEERAERERAEAAYVAQKRGLEERMGLEGSHLSPARLRMLDDYNRDEERAAR